MSIERKSPFSNGTEYMSWLGSNCERCKKSERCAIERSLEIASVLDGTVSDSIYKRMGKEDNMTAFVWMCPEVDWTEEWMAQCLSEQENDC